MPQLRTYLIYFEIKTNSILQIPLKNISPPPDLAQSAGAVEYTDCTSAEG